MGTKFKTGIEFSVSGDPELPQGENIKLYATHSDKLNIIASDGEVKAVLDDSILPLAITKGGTGATTTPGARSNLGLGDVAVENVVPVSKGGTGASTAAGARTNLGALADTVTINGKLVSDNPVLTTDDVAETTTHKYNVQSNWTATNGDSVILNRPTLSTVATSGNYDDLSNKPTLGTIASQSSSNVSITGGSVTGITDLTVEDGGTGASTAAGARTNLGLGGVATEDTVPTSKGGTGLTTIGTAGQVLAVNSNANGLEWTTPTGGGTGGGGGGGTGDLVNPMTAAGDLIVGGTGGTPMRLERGAAGQMLVVKSDVSGLEWKSGMTNPMTTNGDLIIGGLTGAPTRLERGSTGQVLTVNSDGTLAWTTPSSSGSGGGSGNIDEALRYYLDEPGALLTGDYSGYPRRLSPGSPGQVLTVNYYRDGLMWTTPLANPMYTTGDIIVGGSSGEPMRLSKGYAGQVLTVRSDGSGLEWKTPVGGNGDGLVNPMTTTGDLIVGSTDGIPTRLAKGSSGQMLTVNSSGSLSWTTPFKNLMTTTGDLIIGGSSGTPTRLAKGNAGQVLTVSSSGSLTWTTLPNASGGALTNPMTTIGDIIVAGEGGVPGRLAKGSSGQMLTINSSGNLYWAAGVVNPMTTTGDLIIGGSSGTPTKLSKGSTGQMLTVSSSGSLYWSTPLKNPMTTAGDLIVGGSNGSITRLAKGTAGQVLTVNSNASGLEWTTPSTGSSGGMSNPMTAAGDLIIGGTSGTPMRLAKGSAGYVLAVKSDSSGLEWRSVMKNPMTTTGDLIIGGSSGTPMRLSSGFPNDVLMLNSSWMPCWTTMVRVVESYFDDYHENKFLFRRWSDGTVEQYGVGHIPSGGAASITFPYSYRFFVVYVGAIARTGAAEGLLSDSIGAYNVTAVGAMFDYKNADSEGDFNWYAIGR